MFSFNLPYGYPFDPTLDANFTTVSKSGRLKGELKKASTGNFSKYTESEVLMFIANMVNGSKNYSFHVFSQKIFLSELNLNSLEQDHCRHLEILRKFNAKRKNRYFLASDDLYLEAVKESFNGKRTKFDFELTNSGLVAYSKKVLGISDFKNREDVFPLLEKKAGKTKFNRADVEKAAFMMKVALGLFSSQMSDAYISTVLDMSLHDLERGLHIEDAVHCLWSISAIYSVPEIFFLAYHLFSDIFTKNKFPFLKFEILNFIDKILSDDDFLERWYAFIMNEAMLSQIRKNESYEAYSNISMLFEHKAAFADKKKNSIKVIREINEIISESIHFISFFDKAKSQAFFEKVSRVEIPEHSFMDAGLANSLKKEMTLKLGRIIANADKIEGDPEKKVSDLEGKIKELSDKSFELGKDPLKNIDKLNELSKRVSSLNHELSEVHKRHSKAADELIGQFTEVMTYYQSEIHRRADEKSDFKSISELLDISMDETAKLSSMLDDKEKENLVLVEKIKEMNRQSQVDKEKVFGNVHLSELMIKVTSGTATIVDIVRAVSIINDGNILIRDGLLEELARNTEFTRLDVLFKKLLTLTSNQFINEYSENGSIGCFKLFTKTELSFQETKATQSKHSRVYSIGGSEYNCKAHLKIGSDNTEQNMLRIYFAINKEKVIIGDIVKHLPIAKKI